MLLTNNLPEGTFDEEEDDEELSELDVMDEDSDAENQNEDDSGGEVDIRALVGKGRKSTQPPPAKKQRNA